MSLAAIEETTVALRTTALWDVVLEEAEISSRKLYIYNTIIRI